LAGGLTPIIFFVERFRQGYECDRQTTDRPRYGELCRNNRNRLRCKSDSAQQLDTEFERVHEIALNNLTFLVYRTLGFINM